MAAPMARTRRLAGSTTRPAIRSPADPRRFRRALDRLAAGQEVRWAVSPGARAPGAAVRSARQRRWQPGQGPPPAPVAQGGGAAQSRGGLRWMTGSSSCGGAAHGSPSSSASSSGSPPARPALGRDRWIGLHLGVIAVVVDGGRHRRRRRGGAAGRARLGRFAARPSPGTSGRPGRRSRGSTPPGARAPSVPAGPPRSSGVDGRGWTSAHRVHPRRRRTDRPGDPRRRATLGRSSRR